MEEQEVRFGKEESLYGTLTTPDGESDSFPAILILAGSGDVDRNGNSEEQTLNLYNQLADVLTGIRFVTLRFDKVGTGKSEGDFLTAGVWDMIDGAKSALQFLKEQPNVNEEKVFILGHSEGSMLAPEVSKGEGLAGLILLAGGTETLHEAMVYQRAQVVATLKATRGLKGILFKLLKVPKKIKKQGPEFDKRIMNSEDDILLFQDNPINAKWFREHYSFDVKERLKEVTCPVITITGEKDLQSTPERVHDIKGLVQGEAEAHIITGMNHMLRQQEEDYTMLDLKKAYEGIGDQPLSPQLITTIKLWLDRYA